MKCRDIFNINIKFKSALILLILSLNKLINQKTDKHFLVTVTVIKKMIFNIKNESLNILKRSIITK